MKILHIIQRYPPSIGGSETWCQDLCQYLARQGHNVVVLTLDVYNEDEFWREPPIENCILRFGKLEYDSEVRVMRCKRTKIHPLAFYIFKTIEKFFKIYLYGPHSIEMYLRMIKEISEADTVHLHTIPYPHNLIGLFIAKLFRKKVVITPHFHIGHKQYETKINYWLMKKCDAVFAVTNYEKEYLVSRGLNKNKVFVAYNGIDPNEYKPKNLESFKKDVFKKYDIKENTKIVIFIGRKIEYKGIDTLIEATRNLRKKISIKLFLVGPNFPWFDEYYSKLSEEEKRDIIDFGIVSHQTKVNLLHLSHLLVLPSQFEAFGIVFLEAWACGVAVIGTKNMVTSEVLLNSGETFDFGDTNSLEEKISQLLANEVLRQRLVENGRDRIANNFSWDIVGKQILSTYTTFYTIPIRDKTINNFLFRLSKYGRYMFGNSFALSWINWFVTWKCNYRCVYCWQVIGSKFYRDSYTHWKPAKLWADAFNRLNPEGIELTGGEPTLYPELIEFMTLLKPNIRLTMTTNLSRSFDLSKFTQYLKPVSRGGKIEKLALSFHPTQVAFEEFLNRALILKREGFDIQINYVLHPVQMWKVEEFQKEFRKYGLEMHIEPFVAPSKTEGGEVIYFSKDEMAWIKKWISQEASPMNKDRRGKQQFIPGMLKENDESAKKEWGVDRRPVFCDAGRLILNVDENGDAYSCVSALCRSKIFGLNALPHYKPIGNIFSKEFTLLKSPILCWEAFRCCGCDFDRVSRFWKYPSIPKEKWVRVPE